MKTATLSLSALSFIPLLFFPLAEAHGMIGQVTIDGKMYEGPSASDGSPKPNSPIRHIIDPSPITNITSEGLPCGTGAEPALFVAPANPGSTIEVLWLTDDRMHWPHNTGQFLPFSLAVDVSVSDRYLHHPRSHGSVSGFLRLRFMRQVRS